MTDPEPGTGAGELHDCMAMARFHHLRLREDFRRLVARAVELGSRRATDPAPAAWHPRRREALVRIHDRLVDHAEFDEDTWDHLLDQWLEASFQIARACDVRLRRPKRWRAARLARANTMFDFAVLMREGNL
jgi:hypothetical protein